MPDQSMPRNDQLARVSSLSELDGLVEREPSIAVRYSYGPERDRCETSVDYESGLELPGLSCNPLAPEPWWSLPRLDWIVRKLCNYAHLQREDPDRYGWLLIGRTCARGPDNEPLLTDWTAVAVIDPSVLDQAEHRYHERFAVGKDSTHSPS